MSVKNFKFVSPGVFINEIDNSFIPKTAQAIGPVVIGGTTNSRWKQCRRRSRCWVEDHEQHGQPR